MPLDKFNLDFLLIVCNSAIFLQICLPACSFYEYIYLCCTRFFKKVLKSAINGILCLYFWSMINFFPSSIMKLRVLSKVTLPKMISLSVQVDSALGHLFFTRLERSDQNLLECVHRNIRWLIVSGFKLQKEQLSDSEMPIFFLR